MANSDSVLDELYAVIESRKGGDPAKSYTARKFAKGTDHIAKKIGEEATEVAIAAARRARGEIISESADLLFFLMMLLLVWFFLTLVSPSVSSPIVRTVFVLVDPFITPIQKWLPRSKVDFSPLVAAGIFLVLKMLVVTQLIAFSAGMANYSAAGAFS